MLSVWVIITISITADGNSLYFPFSFVLFLLLPKIGPNFIFRFHCVFDFNRLLIRSCPDESGQEHGIGYRPLAGLQCKELNQPIFPGS